MASVISYSVLRRMVTVGGIHWKHLKPQLMRHRNSEILEVAPRFLHSSQSPTFYSLKPEPKSQQKVGPEGQNPPEKFDGGDYDEEKNQEYEDEAERRAKVYRRIKKILSSAMFVSVLGYVGYSRRGKRQEVADNIQNVRFIKDDGLFQGSERVLCEYRKPEMEQDGKVVLPISIVKDGTIRKIERFSLRENDIIVASFPKAGTTWVQEIVYLISNDFNFEEAKQHVLETRFPFLEYPFPGLSSIEKMKSPRLIKTHLPYYGLPNTSGNAKIIYVTRNPKDVVVSYYHFARMFTMFSFQGSFDDFLEKFQEDELPYCPFFGHLESYLNHKDKPNVLIVTYEDLSKDPVEVIKKIASFLGKSLTDEQIQLLAEHTRFENMSANASVNYEHWDDLGFRNKQEAKFMRKGKVGDWKNYLGPMKNDNFDKWIERNNKSQFQFVYE